MDFILNAKQRAQKYSLGFLYRTKLDCEKVCKWMTFNVKSNYLEGKGTYEKNGRAYHFKLVFSPFFPDRFDRVRVETKDLIQCADTHFNADGTLCLYHPILDLEGRPYLNLIDILPWITEWVYCYDKYLRFKTWVLPEYPHN